MLNVSRLALLLCIAVVGAHKLDEGECKWSWKALGCTPAKECKLSFKPWFNTFGPCVLRGKESAPSSETAAATPAAAAEAEPVKADPTEEATPKEPAAAEEVEVSEVKDEA